MFPPSTGRAGLGRLLFFRGQVGTFGAPLEQGRGRGAPAGSAGRGVGGAGAAPLGPAVASFPAPGGAGPGRSRARPRPEAERGPGRRGRAGWAGDARRSRAPYRPRRLARAPTVPVAAGGGSQAAGEEGRWRKPRLERRSPQTNFPGSAGKKVRCARSRSRPPAPAPGPRPPTPGARSARGQAGAAARAAPKARPVRGSGASAALRRRAGRAGFPAALGERWAPRPLRPRRRRRWSGPGVGDLRGGCAGRASAPGRGQAGPRGLPAAGERPGVWRARFVGADKAGRRHPRRLGPPGGWSLGEKRRLWGDGPDQGEVGRPPCGRSGGLLGGAPGRVGSSSLRWAN